MTMTQPLDPMTDPQALRDQYGPYLRGEKEPATAEELMRARYAAYALHEIDFVLQSQHPEKREDTDREGTERWSREADWLGFEVLKTEAGGENDSEGMVEFAARYRIKGVTFSHRERSEFRKHEGKWYFWEGQQVSGPPVRKDPVAGRNDPCPCGSGKKYKKCHGKNG